MASLNTISIPDFPNVKKIPEEGLHEIEPSEATLYSDRIQAFLHKSPKQPSFFVSRESWQLLFKGQTVVNPLSSFQASEVKTWLPEGYEIHAFAFCIATFESESPNHTFSHVYDGLNYFRIRTIIRNVKSDESADNILVEVETGNIAYVSLSTALANAANGTRNDCLKFFTPENVSRGDLFEGNALRKLKKDIDTGVDTWKAQQHSGTSRIKVYDHKEKLIPIEQEGCIFGKDRMENILKSYPKSMGSEIFFELNAPEKMVGFVFKINGNFSAKGIPCPPPIPTCKNVQS